MVNLPADWCLSLNAWVGSDADKGSPGEANESCL